jgi:hypothetical protein
MSKSATTVPNNDHFIAARPILTIYEGPMILSSPDLDGQELGAYFAAAQAIVIADGQHPEDRRETILHEVLHFLYDDCPDTMSLEQHAAIARMANFMLAMTDWLRSDRKAPAPTLEEAEGHRRKLRQNHAREGYVPTPVLIAELKRRARARPANPADGAMAALAVHRATQAHHDGAITVRTWKRYIKMILDDPDGWYTVLGRLTAKAHWKPAA